MVKRKTGNRKAGVKARGGVKPSARIKLVRRLREWATERKACDAGLAAAEEKTLEEIWPKLIPNHQYWVLYELLSGTKDQYLANGYFRAYKLQHTAGGSMRTLKELPVVVRKYAKKAGLI